MKRIYSRTWLRVLGRPIRNCWIISLVFSCRITMAQPTNQAGMINSEFIFEPEKVSFPECHASTIAETHSNLVAAWFGGTGEKNPDVGIWLARRENNKWTAPIEVVNGVVSDAVRYACWNPVLFQPRKGPLLLFYKIGPSPSKWWGMLVTSQDDGTTWSKPHRLPDGILGPIKNKPIQLPNGDILCPSSTEQNGWQVHFERTPDLGETWESTSAVNDGKEIGAIQPSILQHAGARLQALGRTRQGRIFEIWSEDQGRTWGKMTSTSLPNPNSGIDAATLGDGRHVLVYNHSTRGRTPLNVAISSDGIAWQAAMRLETAPGEYSYPAVIQTSDGLVHVTYTWKRARIRHIVIDPTKLELRPIINGAWPKGN